MNFMYSKLKNRSSLSGQNVVKIKRLGQKGTFAIACLRKNKVLIRQIANFANREL